MEKIIKRVVFILSTDIVAKLREASYKRHESMSSIVRKAILEYLK